MPRLEFPKEDLSGQRFGRLVALRPVRREQDPTRFYWQCRCDCGGEKVTTPRQLKSGNCQSCGCILREITLARCQKHGRSKTPLYAVWLKMISRCHNPKDKRYDLYGARGISVCDRWRDFESFASDMGPKPTPKHSVERIDNDGAYSPENCRWATQFDQMHNNRRNRLVTAFGKTKIISDWARDLGASARQIGLRLDKGMSPEEAVSRPIRKSNHPGHPTNVRFQEKTQSIAAWCRELKLNPALVAARFRRGWTPEDAFFKPVDSRRVRKTPRT